MSLKQPPELAIGRRDGDSAKPVAGAVVVICFEGNPSRDGYDTRLEVEMPVRLHDSPVDRRAFADRFLRFSPVGTAEQVADYLRPQLDRNVASVIAERPVSELMDGKAGSAVAAEIKAAAVKPLFAAGLELDGEPMVRFGSPDWQRRRVEEAADAARLAAAEREGELLRRFEDIRRQNPDVPAGALLMGLPKGERVDALRALLKAAGGRQASRVFAVAGDTLYEINVARDEVWPISLSGELGPLRSVLAIHRTGMPRLLVGARDGVYLVDPSASDSAEAFDADVEGSPFGFSQLGYDEESGVIYATHADVGLVSWQIDLGTQTVLTAKDFDGLAPRQIDARGSEVHVAAGGRLWRVGPNHAPRSLAGLDGEPIAMVAGTEREVLVVCPSGAVQAVSRADGTVKPVTSRGDVVSVGAGLPWLGELRLVLGDGFSTSLVQIGPHDDVRMTLTDAQGPFKALAAGADMVVGISSDRSRLVAWRPWEERSFADLHVISRTRSRLADVAVLRGG